MPTRRDFLHTGSLALLAAGVGLPRAAMAHGTPVGYAPRAGDPILRELAMRAIDAARAAGAGYADVRLTVTRTQSFMYASPPVDSERIAVSVRALADGSWGFAASPEWTLDVVARLGSEATEQARANAWRGAPPIELDDRPPPAAGSWTMPVARDPFTVAVEEKLDYIRSAESYARMFRHANASSVMVFERQERTFASTDGAFCTQTVYDSLGNGSFFAVGVTDPVTYRTGQRNAELVGPAGQGYEIFEEAKLLDQIPRLYEEARRLLTADPVSVGRYDVVFDAHAVAQLVDRTIGAALEADRALGFEANAGGTSYLAPPDRMLGNTIGSPMVTITADRSRPGGAATVRWDDEGVEPADFTLVKDGVVMDYSTNRELSRAIGAGASANGSSVRSRGCAASSSAANMPLVHAPNLTMHPGKEDLGFAELIAGVEDGLAVQGGRLDMDHQLLNAQGIGEVVYRVKQGKIVGTVYGAGFLLQSSRLWKDLVAIGGARSAAVRGIRSEKGQPRQAGVRSVSAVPARFRDVRVINVRAGR
jgi:TldD protein